MIKKYNKNTEKEAKGKEVDWFSYTDMYIYIVGHYLNRDHPYLMYEWNSVLSEGYSIKESGEELESIALLLMAVKYGSTPAFHEVMEFARSSDKNLRCVDSICQSFLGVDYESWELSLMEDLIELRDNEAMRLGLKHYQK